MSLHQRWILQFHWISSFNPFTFSSLKVNTRIPFTVPFLCDNITSQTEFFVHGPNICLSFALFLTRRPHLGKFWLQILTDSHIDIRLFDWSYNKQLATRLVSWEYIGNLRRVRDQSDLELTCWSKGWTVTKTIWSDGQERQDSQLAQIALVLHRCYLHKVDNLGLLLFPTIVAIVVY